MQTGKAALLTLQGMRRVCTVRGHMPCPWGACVAQMISVPQGNMGAVHSTGDFTLMVKAVAAAFVS